MGSKLRALFALSALCAAALIMVHKQKLLRLITVNNLFKANVLSEIFAVLMILGLIL